MWSARPIFISSTFLDIQAERDHLRTRVFPELEERLRARRHHLEWVDLRVGVATASQRDEHLRELHVLKVCLAEVARCRPFLIVLVGDRYGWVPAPERIKAAAQEAGFATDVAGRSVTDLEIDFGVLADREQQPHSIFYFRDPLPYREMPAAIAALYSDAFDAGDAAADRTRRLVTLKRRIETLLPGGCAAMPPNGTPRSSRSPGSKTGAGWCWRISGPTSTRRPRRRASRPRSPGKWRSETRSTISSRIARAISSAAGRCWGS